MRSELQMQSLSQFSAIYLIFEMNKVRKDGMQLRSMLKIYICFSLMEKKKKKNKSIISSSFYIPFAYRLVFPFYFYCCRAVFTGLTSVSVYQWAISGALVISCSETEELSLQCCCSPDYQSALRLSQLRNNIFGTNHTFTRALASIHWVFFPL